MRFVEIGNIYSCKKKQMFLQEDNMLCPTERFLVCAIYQQKFHLRLCVFLVKF